VSLLEGDDRRRKDLTEWLQQRMPDAHDVQLAPFTFPKAGNSAESIFVEMNFEQMGARKQRKLVVRRQYDDYRLFLSGTLERQWEMLSTVAELSAVPVPPRIGIEKNSDLLGGPFFVTGHVEGRIPPDNPGYNHAGWLKDESTPEQRGILWHHGLKTLADIHGIQPAHRFDFLDEREDGPAGLDAYLRYVRRWHDWVAGNRIFSLVEAAFEYLLTHRPSLDHNCVLWGDSRPGNIIFAPDGTVAAVLDWEMAALGPAEIDLGWWLMFNEYHVAVANGDPQLAGLPNRDDNIAIYENYAGRKVADMYYFEVLAWLRFAITHTRWRDRMTAHKKLPDDPNGYSDNVCMRGLSKQLGVSMPATPFILRGGC